jgi:hypothetical protein
LARLIVIDVSPWNPGDVAPQMGRRAEDATPTALGGDRQSGHLD